MYSSAFITRITHNSLLASFILPDEDVPVRVAGGCFPSSTSPEYNTQYDELLSPEIPFCQDRASVVSENDDSLTCSFDDDEADDFGAPSVNLGCLETQAEHDTDVVTMACHEEDHMPASDPAVKVIEPECIAREEEEEVPANDPAVNVNDPAVKVIEPEYVVCEEVEEEEVVVVELVEAGPHSVDEGYPQLYCENTEWLAGQRHTGSPLDASPVSTQTLGMSGLHAGYI